MNALLSFAQCLGQEKSQLEIRRRREQQFQQPCLTVVGVRAACEDGYVAVQVRFKNRTFLSTALGKKYRAVVRCKQHTLPVDIMARVGNLWGGKRGKKEDFKMNERKKFESVTTAVHLYTTEPNRTPNHRDRVVYEQQKQNTPPTHLTHTVSFKKSD